MLMKLVVQQLRTYLPVARGFRAAGLSNGTDVRPQWIPHDQKGLRKSCSLCRQQEFLGVTGWNNRCLRPLTLAQTNRWHCPLGAHVFSTYQRRHRPARRHRANGSNQGGNFSLSLMVARQRCRFRRNVHHLPVHPLHHPPDGLQWYASIGIGHRNFRRHVEP